MSQARDDLERAGNDPGFWGSLVYLLMNFPLGIAAFVAVTTAAAVGLGTAVIWVGIPILALLVLGARGAARLERARVYAMLDTYIPMPYRPLPEAAQRDRWKARLRDGATWRDFGYLLVLLPLGIFEFTLLVGAWATSLGLAGLPIYFRYLPDGTWFFPSDGWAWVTVDSTVEALPWAALGVLFCAVSVALTKGLGRLHAKVAAVVLGPSSETLRQFVRGDVTTERPVMSGSVAGW